MKDKNIESWTKLNRDRFDDKELPVNHRETFEKKLNFMLHEKAHKKETFNWYRIAGVAVVFIAIASSVFFYSPNPTVDIQTASFSNFEEVENQYSSKIKQALVPVRSSNKYLSPEYRSFLKEMEKLDQENEKLKDLLVQFPDDERILNSIISNYKSRLDLLEQLQATISNKNLNKKDDGQSL